MHAKAGKIVNRPAAAQPAAAFQPVHVATPAPAVQFAGAMKVSSPHDPAEKEAEQTAQRVMRMAEPGPLATASPSSPSIARMAGAIRQSAPLVARKPEGEPKVSPQLAGEISAGQSHGNPLPPSVRGFMEPRFAASFDNVRVHTGNKAARLSRRLSAQAFTVGSQIFFGKGKFQPDSHEGKELIAHELTHTIQQGAVVQRSTGTAVVQRSVESEVQRSPAIVVSERSSPQAQRLGASDALNHFADKANLLPGFRMLTIILGLNPINQASVDRNAANILRALVEFIPGGALITQALDKYGVFDKVGAWVEKQIKGLGLVGSAFGQAITQFLDSLSWKDIFDLGGLWNRAKSIFTEPIDRLVAFAKGLAHDILQFIKDAILRPLAALAAGTPGWELLCAVLGKNPVTDEKVPSSAETIIPPFLKLIGEEEIWENMKKAKAISRAYAWFRGAMSGLLGFVQQIPGLFLAALKALVIEDIVVLPQAFVKVGKAFAGFLGKFASWVGGVIWDLLKLIFEVVAPAVIVYLKKAAGALPLILKNPGAFVGNLVKASKLAFAQFRENFLTHLKKSFINWLTGALKGAAIYVPTALTLEEVGKFVLSVLGVSWAKIRAKIVKALGPKGETIMKTAETTVDVVVALAKGGTAGLWEMVKEKLGNLKDMVVDAVIGFVKEKVVVAAVTKLVSMLNPAGAFYQAIMAIYNTVMFFIERRSQIAAVVAAFIDSIAGVASGAFAAAANLIEKMMAATLTVVLAFFARLAGLGRVTDHIVAKVLPLQEKVDQGIDKGIAWIKEKIKALVGKLLGKGKKPASDLENAVAEAKQEMVVKGATVSSVQAKLPVIQAKYKLTSLVLVKNKENQYHVKATINPSLEAPPGILFTAEELVELDKVAREYATHINRKDNEERNRGRPGFKANAMANLEEFIKRGGNVQTGKMVEAMAAPAIQQLATEAGLTLIKGAYVQWIGASGRAIGGKGPELDFLLVGSKGIQEVVSAKFKVGRVDISNDISHLSTLQTLPTDGATLVAELTSGRFGRNNDFPNVVRANVVSNLGTMSLSAFRAKYLSRIPVHQIVITPLTPGPGQPDGLQLRVTRDELVRKTAELMRPYL